ncbi:MAG: isochorismate synthase [Ktedonobacteraceae bacterium]|nr:isochorismate synthase [Ktedonobacteraceae bacterium]
MFTTTSSARFAGGAWPVGYERRRLIALWHQAAARATDEQRPVLVCYTIAVQPRDALQVWSTFTRLHLGDCCFWELPDQGSALVGLGVVTANETTGQERFAEATAAWRTLCQRAVIGSEDSVDKNSGPVLVGGFAFDALPEQTALWEGFPEGLLILPRLLYQQRAQKASLTISALLEPGCDVETQVQEAESLLARLRTHESNTEQRAGVEHEAGAKGPGRLVARDIQPPEEWQRTIAHAVEAIRGGAYEKVVLARSVEVTQPEAPFEIEETLTRLRESYSGAYVFAFQRGGRYFVGATPERLIYARDGQLRTMALAGSYPRGATEEEDQRLGAELLSSAKNRQEHEFVVSLIRTALADLCSKVWVADAPHLLRLKNIQHLETPIFGELLPGRSVLEALEVLHPTPAVGGLPRQAALEAIRAHEQLDRGWYAGPVGWVDAQGNGEFAVALRSALVEGNKATLFAGCGIVAGSNPEGEYAESCWKLQVMLRGLGGEDCEIAK